MKKLLKKIFSKEDKQSRDVAIQQKNELVQISTSESVFPWGNQRRQHVQQFYDPGSFSDPESISNMSEDQQFQEIDQQKFNQSDFYQYCDVLDLDKKDAGDIQTVKRHFKQKITAYAHLKCQTRPKQDKIIAEKEKKRTQVLIAYHHLTSKIFNTIYSFEHEQLILAIYKNEVNIVSQMIASNPQLLDFKTKGKEQSLLYLAARSGHVEMVEFILQKRSPTSFQSRKSTPFHIAAWCGHYHVVKLLLKYKLPWDIRNQYGNTPKDQAIGAEIQDLFLMAEIGPMYNLLSEIRQTELENRRYRILERVEDGQVCVKKIILNNYQQDFNGFVDAFHGTDFQNFMSIATHGLKKPGSRAGDLTIQVQEGNIQANVQLNDIQDWSKAIYTSPSIHYANQYAKPLRIFDMKQGRDVEWRAIVQVKIQRGGFGSFEQTLGFYERVDNQPQLLEYRSEDESKVHVVALMLVKRKWIGLFKNQKQQDYNKTSKFILQDPCN